MAKTKTKTMKLSPQTLPVALPGATLFSDDRDALSPLQIIRLLKQHPEILDELLEATTISHKGRRQRIEGSWALALLAFVCARGYVDIEPWWADSIDTTVWEECGFADRPSYQTTYDRFVELEQYEEHFRLAANKLIRRARVASGGLVGRDGHVDGTEAESPARLVHICGPNCPKLARQEDENDEDEEGADANGAPKKKRRPAKLPDRISTGVARAIRHADTRENAPAEKDQHKLYAGDARKIVTKVDKKTGREYLEIETNWGCKYRSLDTTAGARAYTGTHGAFRYWHGFYNIKTVDHYTGGALDVFVMNASINEFHANDVIVDRLKVALGEAPRALCYDKGFSIERVYRRNTQEGIATVAPFRGGRYGNRADYDCDRYDRHGIPRCKHCGAEGRFVSFVPKPNPRLLFTCSMNCPDAKGKRMSINCDEKWRLLVPLWRTTEAYMGLRRSSRAYKEGIHRYWRQRYGVAGKDFDTRPKRIGVAWQQLRASVALLAEWVKICWRQGWLDSECRNHTPPKVTPGKKEAENLLSYRIFIGLDARAEGQVPPKDPFTGDDDDGPPDDAGPPGDEDGPPEFVTAAVDEIVL
jgi:hypothetical protein